MSQWIAAVEQVSNQDGRTPTPIWPDAIAEINSHFIGGLGEWAQTVSGTGAAVAFTTPDPGGHPGIANLSTGTTISGQAIIQSQAAAVLIGNGFVYLEAALRVPVLSNVTDRFSVTVGLFDNPSGPAASFGIGYSDSANGGKWYLVKTGVTTDTGITVVAGTWYRLRLAIDAAAANGYAYVASGAYPGTFGSATQASPSALCTTPAIRLVKTAGTTARTVDLDYLRYSQHLSPVMA